MGVDNWTLVLYGHYLAQRFFIVEFTFEISFRLFKRLLLPQLVVVTSFNRHNLLCFRVELKICFLNRLTLATQLFSAQNYISDGEFSN